MFLPYCACLCQQFSIWPWANCFLALCITCTLCEAELTLLLASDWGPWYCFPSVSVQFFWDPLWKKQTMKPAVTYINVLPWHITKAHYKTPYKQDSKLFIQVEDDEPAKTLSLSEDKNSKGECPWGFARVTAPVHRSSGELPLARNPFQWGRFWGGNNSPWRVSTTHYSAKTSFQTEV